MSEGIEDWNPNIKVMSMGGSCEAATSYHCLREWKGEREGSVTVDY